MAMPLEQQIACILQSKHQQILKMLDMNRKAVHRSIEALGSADVLTRWRQPPSVYQSFVCRSQIVYKLAYSSQIS